VKPSLLEAVGLGVAYGTKPILDISHLSLAEGETLAVIGPNGAGKSTLMRVLAFLEAPTRGEVRFEGRPLRWRSRELISVRRKFASVFQEPLLCDTTVEANVTLGLRLRGERASDARIRTRIWMEKLGIGRLGERSVRTLSVGEAQRTSLARALATDPKILFLDEAFAALDTPSRERLLIDFQNLRRESRTTAIIVTQNQDEALRLADRVAVLMDGRLEQIGPSLDVFRKPVTEKVARFVGMETVLPGRVSGVEDRLLRIESRGTEIRARGMARKGETVLVGIRPEEIALQRLDLAVNEKSSENRLTGRVTGLRPMGSHVRLQVDCGETLVALVPWRILMDLSLQEGSGVLAAFTAESAHVIRLDGNGRPELDSDDRRPYETNPRVVLKQGVEKP
jgi:tungstate transport system ATP-binding protein